MPTLLSRLLRAAPATPRTAWGLPHAAAVQAVTAHPAQVFGLG